MKTIKHSYHINAPIDQVWQALVNPEHIKGWSGSPSEMDDKVGTKFSLWGGDIHGTNIEVVNPPTGGKKLIQEWYAGDWPQASRVTFTLNRVADNETEVDLLHETVPDKEYKEINEGWNQYYLGAIKNYLEPIII